MEGGQGAEPVVDLSADPRGVDAVEPVIRVVPQHDGDAKTKVRLGERAVEMGVDRLAKALGRAAHQGCAWREHKHLPVGGRMDAEFLLKRCCVKAATVGHRAASPLNGRRQLEVGWRRRHHERRPVCRRAV